jgi:hypothetical protein
MLQVVANFQDRARGVPCRAGKKMKKYHSAKKQTTNALQLIA